MKSQRRFREASVKLECRCHGLASGVPHRRSEGAEIDATFRNLLLNPANVSAVGDDDPDFLQLEKLSEVLFFTTLVPAEHTFYDFTDRFEVQIACESDIIFASCTKRNLHSRFPSNFFVVE